MTRHQVVLIPGDGIGPEVTAAVQRVLKAVEAPIEWVEHVAGLSAIERGRDALPTETLDAIRTHAVALKGPCTTPIGEGFVSINVRLRKELDLYAAVRPVRNLDGVPTRYQGVDLVIVRENTEGLYSGIEA
ncbi:MAG TPA: isocitrate/isopropylmalate family dehydrogenase, partial [Methylomirabilota bacterium]|nr:isocitrate/isopropylmalate family dehydrogenase [Methylomirabilota bacterium]